MLRCQFLCHVSKALFFIKIALKLSYVFLKKKMQNFRALLAPRPPASDSCGLLLQTPKTALPPLQISGYAPESMSWPGVPKPGGMGGTLFGEDFFFGLHLICFREKNSGQASSPQC